MNGIEWILTRVVDVTLTANGQIASFTEELAVVLFIASALAGAAITYATLTVLPAGRAPAAVVLTVCTAPLISGISYAAPLVFAFTLDELTVSLQVAALGTLMGVGAAIARWKPHIKQGSSGPVEEQSTETGDPADGQAEQTEPQEFAEEPALDPAQADERAADEDAAPREETNTSVPSIVDKPIAETRDNL